MQWPVIHVFTRRGGEIFHFWGTELASSIRNTQLGHPAKSDAAWQPDHRHAGMIAMVRPKA
jgi:hypothetical protein